VTVGFNPARVSTAAPRRSIAEAMSRSEFYARHPAVTVRETHTAWVFLAGTRAYKVKKPVRMEFLDFTTPERRRAACEAELRVNRELAPGIYLRLRAVLALSDGYALVDPRVSGAVDYAIEMRRFDERQTLAALLERGALGEAPIRAVAQRLAAFPACATPAPAPADRAGDVKRACDRNLRELLALADAPTARRVLRAERFTDAFLVAHRGELADRARAGLVRDGHGDLRAEHIVLEEPLAIVDRLEFDPALRLVDTADDLAFLVMDLERLGARDAARLLVDAYRAAGADPGSDELLAFYGVHRALVRAKVALLRAGQLDGEAAAGARADADALLALAERLTWRARGPLVLAISGPPASGKSTLAAALARRSGLPVLSSDALRKRRLGLPLSAAAPADAYTDSARAAVYRELGATAGRGSGAIIDATFGDPLLRDAFLQGLGDTRRLRALECQAPASVRDRWARARTPGDAHGSDAAADVAARVGARHSGWDGLSDEAILTLRSASDAELLVDQVADWLDMTSVVFPATQRVATEVAAGVPT
jgi:aminoglycoside phosphotransferase family enzyme/predicted kinase